MSTADAKTILARTGTASVTTGSGLTVTARAPDTPGGSYRVRLEGAGGTVARERHPTRTDAAKRLAHFS
jgi:hypothetical protein